MTTERAIELLHRLQDEQFDGEYGDERREALEMAVRALEQNLVKESGDLVQDLVKDCISRRAAMIVIENSGLDDDSKDTVVRVLEQLPPAQPQWIPCSERLPNEDEEVLVTSNSGIFIAVWNKMWGKTIHWFETVEGKSLHKVTAWMPLPEPYGGENE